MQIGEDSKKNTEMKHHKNKTKQKKNRNKVTIKVRNEHYYKNKLENYWVLMILRNAISFVHSYWECYLYLLEIKFQFGIYCS